MEMKPQALRSAFESFLDDEYAGQPGTVNVFSIADVFCRDEGDASQLAQHLTSTVVYGGSHTDHGMEQSDGHFDFSFNPNSVKARFILWGNPDWQSRVLAELHTCSRDFANAPRQTDGASMAPFRHQGSMADRYGYAGESKPPGH